jgi:hypothetical protein
MSLAVFLARITSELESMSIEDMVCGSVASIFHGVPRTTQDVDIVVSLTGFDAKKLASSLDEEQFYVSESAAVDAVVHQRQFNIIDMETGWKADLIVRKRRPFSQVEFDRRVRVEMLGTKVWVATAEDTVLAKLEWSKRSGSLRQIEDARGIVEMQGASLDTTYLHKWARELDVQEQLASLAR